MRKLKFLLAVCALLVSVGVQAQKDVTSEYIKNATLANGTTDWTNVNFNTPVQGNNTVGYASECYAGWDNLNVKNYSLTQTITLPAGHYTLVNYSFYRYGLNADTDPTLSYAFLKAGEQQVAVKTLGSITAAGYANTQAEGANAFDSKMYRNALDFTIDADNTDIEIGLVGTHELKQSWMICGMFELINNDIAATMDHPFDVTGYITNPGFEYRDMTGWTVTGGLHTQNNSQGFKVGGYYAENWQPSGALPAGSMSQTLSNLPAGYYKLTANLGGNGTYIDLNGKIANWEADKDYTVGYVLAENENLIITAGKTAEGTANWIHFDNFRLHFCGDVAAALTTLCAKVTDYQAVLPANAYQALAAQVAQYNKTYSDVDELLAAIDAVQALYDAADLYIAYAAAFAAAQAIDQTAPMNAEVLTALQTAMATQVTMQSTAAEAIAATNALNTATANATTSIANYVEAKTILDAANSYDATGQASYAANETIVAIQEAYDNRTLTAVSNEQKSAAAAALTAACKAQAQPADGCDMTAYIVNPGIDGNTYGWTCNKYGNTGGTGGPMKPSNDAMEYWGGNPFLNEASTKGFDYYQTITGLPNGIYTIGADLLHSTNGESGADWNGGGTAGVYGKTGSSEVIELVTTDGASNGEIFLPYTTDGIVVYNGTLTIGVKNIAPMTGRWFACDNFKLTYVRQLEEGDKTTFTASFVNGEGWEKVCAYAWNTDTDVKTAAWPGDEITKSGTKNYNGTAYDVYTYSITDYGMPKNIIFNQGDDQKKTADLTFVDGMVNDDFVTKVPVYAVVGSNQAETDPAFFSGIWDAATITDVMTESDGKWTISFTNVTLTEPVVFKVIKKAYLEATEAEAWYPSGDNVLIDQTGDFDIVITLANNEVSYALTPLTELFTVTDAGWATAKTSHAVDFTNATGLTAYIATLTEGKDKVILTEATTVPANTPIVLKGETGVTVTAKATIIETADAIENNALTWYDTYTVNDSYAHIYALAINKDNGKAQFTRVKDGLTFTNKAVIEQKISTTTARESFDIVFADETTGINTVAVEKNAEGIFNMNGQRVAAPAKGLYIVNGKKVILK